MLFTSFGLITLLGFSIVLSRESFNREQFSAFEFSQPAPTDSPSLCNSSTRILNPSEDRKPEESELDRYFRLAFQAETAANFSEAIDYYQKAYDLAPCECDQQHALAGRKAAEEAQDIGNRYGAESKPTQYFWERLQKVTQALPCVKIQP